MIESKYGTREKYGWWSKRRPGLHASDHGDDHVDEAGPSATKYVVGTKNAVELPHT
jgi:hypothetical protein